MIGAKHLRRNRSTAESGDDQAAREPAEGSFAASVVTHHAQRTANGCVPACLVMVLQARGIAVDAFDLEARLQPSPRGVSFTSAQAHLLGPPSELIQTDPTDPRTIPWIRARLQERSLLVVQVFSAKMAAVAVTAGLGAGPHGDLPSGPGWLHAVVVASATATGFILHDPWFDRGQPMEMSFVDFAEALHADVIVVRG